MRFVVERVHLDFDLILPLHVTRTAYVEVFVQKSFTPITVHVNIRHCNGSNECKFMYIMLVRETTRKLPTYVPQNRICKRNHLHRTGLEQRFLDLAMYLALNQ